MTSARLRKVGMHPILVSAIGVVNARAGRMVCGSMSGSQGSEHASATRHRDRNCSFLRLCRRNRGRHNPPGTGQPGQTCLSQTAPNEPATRRTRRAPRSTSPARRRPAERRAGCTRATVRTPRHRRTATPSPSTTWPASRSRSTSASHPGRRKRAVPRCQLPEKRRADSNPCWTETTALSRGYPLLRS
jgi:hypothetical protein